MPLIVDCNNLLHVSMPQALAGLDEAGLCRLLALSPWLGQRIVVVCDGAVNLQRPDKSPVEQVELVYSGGRRVADDLIIEMIDADTAPRRLTIVSTDREIRRAARRRRARAITSEQFVSQLLKMKHTRRPAGLHRTHKHATGPMSEQEVQHWLDEFGIRDRHDVDDHDDLPWGYDRSQPDET